jgi:hypothetical protein
MVANRELFAMALTWEDTRNVKMDHTMHMGHGYDWDGWDLLREEAETSIGRFAVWPAQGKWSYYGGKLAWFGSDFWTKEAAQNAVSNLVADYERSAAE